MLKSLRFFQKILAGTALTLALGLMSMPAPAEAETRVASWNIKRLSEGPTDLERVAKVIAHFDLVAIQEVMEEHALMLLVAELQEVTGEEWGVMASHAIGRGSYKEHYAFLWRKSLIDYVDGAVVYLDDRDVFAREPLSARFSSADGTFILANIHVLYGDSKSDREPEIRALRAYWDWLGTTFPDEQYFLVGDFNMPPDDASFSALGETALPLIRSGATTLAHTDGQYANLYDNIWAPLGLKAGVSAGIFDLISYLGDSNDAIRESVSDHAPVYMILDRMDETSGLYQGGYVQEEEAIPEGPLVRGNSESKIFHVPGCAYYDQMSTSANLVGFSSEEEAEAQDYRKARNCP
jgi:endonuclease/exonuclease/phosphatase family metal-dependent hydrolase